MTYAKTLASIHRDALIELGWRVGHLIMHEDGSTSFEVYGPVRPHRRTFEKDGAMLVTRHKE
jgi:hypothetical protein